MDFKDRRTLFVLGGGAVALLAGLIIAGAMLAAQHREPIQPPPASSAGLVIDSSGPEDERMDPAKPLRCFVAGQFVGELTLAECAKRNGVATDALDVGLDETGALAAADQAGAMLTPLPPAAEAPEEAAADEAPGPPLPVNAPVGGCLRYDQGKWARLPGDMSLNACVQALFAGRCERAGGATYGRWMQQTLRLVPGRVEVSADNHSFRTLADQGAGCAITPVG
ncbi:MAG: hypothetical protein ACREE0_18745 [Phenylobacterium sp.]